MERDWELQDDGSIGQSLADMQDSSIRLFTETAASHNQKIKDEEPKTDVQ